MNKHGVSKSGLVDTKRIQLLFNKINNVEASCLILGSENDSEQLIDDLCDSIHAIKEGLASLELKQFTPLLQGVEDLLQASHGKTISVSNNLPELVRLGLATTRQLIEEKIIGSTSVDQNSLDKWVNSFHKLLISQPDHQPRLAENLVMELDSYIHLDSLKKKGPLPAIKSRLDTSTKSQNLDIDFFKEMAKACETRTPSWEGRHQQILNIVWEMNHLRDNPVNPKQLTAAVFLHDIALPFCPIHILNRENKLNKHDEFKMQSHPVLAAKLLKNVGSWNEAVSIIEQHHEYVDGSGYPRGLKGDQICIGAKLIAIADHYVSHCIKLSHSASIESPSIASIEYMSKLAGKQLDKMWCEVFLNLMGKSQISH